MTVHTVILKRSDSKKCMGGSKRIREYNPPAKQAISMRTGRIRDDEKTDDDSKRKKVTNILIKISSST